MKKFNRSRLLKTALILCLAVAVSSVMAFSAMAASLNVLRFNKRTADTSDVPPIGEGIESGVDGVIDGIESGADDIMDGADSIIDGLESGMDPDSESLCIQIHTRKTDSGSQIIVEDNGSGFEPANDGEPHIGLANIEQRLDVMCGGWLDIAPREGGGTVVRVTIPG